MNESYSCAITFLSCISYLVFLLITLVFKSAIRQSHATKFCAINQRGSVERKVYCHYNTSHCVRPYRIVDSVTK